MENITSIQCTTISIEGYYLISSHWPAIPKATRSRKRLSRCARGLIPTKTMSLHHSMTLSSTKTRSKHSNWQMVAKSWSSTTIIQTSISIHNQATPMTWSVTQSLALDRWHLWTNHLIPIIKSLRAHSTSTRSQIYEVRIRIIPRQDIEPQLYDITRKRSPTKATPRPNHILTKTSQSEAASTILWIVVWAWPIMHRKGLAYQMKRRNWSRKGLYRQPNQQTKAGN